MLNDYDHPDGRAHRRRAGVGRAEDDGAQYGGRTVAGRPLPAVAAEKGRFPMSKRRSPEGESDVEDDEHVAMSRAGRENDGDYVGRTAADDDFDAGETGAEAR